jgi:hypothetical protein
MFNTLKPLSIVSERITKINDESVKIIAGKLFILNYFGRTVWKLSLQG